MFPVILILAGCGTDSGPSKKTMESMAMDAQSVDVTLPDDIAGRPPAVQATYRLVYANQDVLKYIPCYCGCVDEGYTSNLNCYIDEMKGNGEVAWDKMGMT